MRHSRLDAKTNHFQDLGLIASGILIGAITGAVVALLVAPRTGAETRDLLARRAQRVRRRAEDRLDDLGEEARLITHRGSVRARRALRRARLAAEAAIKD